MINKGSQNIFKKSPKIISGNKNNTVRLPTHLIAFADSTFSLNKVSYSGGNPDLQCGGGGGGGGRRGG